MATSRVLLATLYLGLNPGSAFSPHVTGPLGRTTAATGSRFSAVLGAKNKSRKRKPSVSEPLPSDTLPLGTLPSSAAPPPPPPGAPGPAVAPRSNDLKPTILDGVEDDFGASSASLAAALEYGLPFPSEASYGAGDSSDDNALFELPDVSDLESKRRAREATRTAKAVADAQKDESRRIKRKDLSTLRARLELDPAADYDDSTFVKEYDVTSALLAESAQPFLAIDAAYLQAGHLILLLTSVLCAFAEYPGNPLTELPAELRAFLKSGMAVTLAVNAVLAALSVPLAASKKQPVPLWAGKSLLLGGLAFDELHRAPDLGKKQNKPDKTWKRR